MRSTIALIAGLAAFAAVAGPLDEKKAELHLQSVASGDIESIMRDYADDAWLDWVGGPLDGRYRGKAAIREAWKKFSALNDGQPRPARIGKLSQQNNPKGATLEAGVEYGGKTPVKVWHVMVYRDGMLSTEIWQISPGLKLGE